MSIPSPNLDDRSFEQLLGEAKAMVARSDCGWTDLGPSDPGAVLLEVFTHLTTLMLYRLNRLPEKVYVELLRLVGVHLTAPAAARAQLSFNLARPQSEPVVIPVGTRVTVGRWTGPDIPVFETLEAATIAPGNLAASGVAACHCTTVRAELAAVGTGLPGQWVTAAQAPIIAPSGDDLDLIVGVEATPDELNERMPALSHDGKTYRIWTPVENFAVGDPDACSYVVDRYSGRVGFAPAVRAVDDRGGLSAIATTLARVPAPGRAIRLWYRRGGGENGNLPANSLVLLRDPLRGIQVTNPEPASGGAAAETVENAILRGPGEMHSLRRAVTARDFESVALRSSAAVARAKVFTKAALWKHAEPGTVEMLLVPKFGTLEDRGGGKVTREALQALESADVCERVLAEVEQRRTLGTACLVDWVRYKTVIVKLRVVVYRGEDKAAVRARVLERLYLTLSPLPTPLQRGGWHFGEPLRASHIYDIVLPERGVSYLDSVQFIVDEVPNSNVEALARDPCQPDTWYAASEQTLYRSLNDGDSWEPAGRFAGQTTRTVTTSTYKPGLLAVATRMADDSARVQVSWDCGESWSQAADFAFPVNGLAWIERKGVQVLLVATDKGLYERTMEDGASPVQLTVDPANPGGGFYSVVSFVDGRGGLNVAVAARQLGGVFISRSDGRTETFVRIHPSGAEDIRVLAVQRLGLSVFLWAGIASAGNEAGKGCLRWELPSSPQSVEAPDGWRRMQVKWQGGSCRVLVFAGERVFAGTHTAGVAVMDSAKPEGGWELAGIHCGLPMRGPDKPFAPVQALAISSDGEIIMAGGQQGVFRSRGDVLQFEEVSDTEFADKVALPPTWLFCSGAHVVEVVSADEAR